MIFQQLAKRPISGIPGGNSLLFGKFVAHYLVVKYTTEMSALGATRGWDTQFADRLSFKLELRM